MTIISSIEELESHYGTPGEASLIKVSDRLNNPYRRFVEASPFLILATCGPEGLDCSPRGDAGRWFALLMTKPCSFPTGAATIGLILCAISCVTTVLH